METPNSWLRSSPVAGSAAASPNSAPTAVSRAASASTWRRTDGTLKRHLDLPQAFAASPPTDAPREWRVHFHVPLFQDRYGSFEGTQVYVTELLRLVRARTDCAHFEVETYTWDVLPEEFRRQDIVTAVSRELAWAAERLA